MSAKQIAIASGSCLLACWCLLVAIAGYSQGVVREAPPPARPNQTKSSASTLRVTSRLVEVTVSVQDKDGKPVTGLTKDDFTVLDQGQRQQIATFSVEQTNRLVANANGATMPPNRFSNHITPGPQPPLTVIVLDAYYSRFFDIQTCPNGPIPPYARCFDTVGTIFHEVETFISRMQPQDRVALYEVANQLYLLQDFTSDPAALQRGLDRGKEFASRIFIPRAQMEPIDMESHAMDAMHAIADRLAKVPGRKNLIWLAGDGFPPARGLTSDKIDKTAKQLGNADLPLTEMDAREIFPICAAPSCGGSGDGGGGGMRGGPVSGADSPTPMSGSYGVGSTTGRRPQLHDFDYAKNLAEETGGKGIENTNDLAGVMRKVIDDSAASYVLGYYPAHDKWNGEFHEIKVKVDRPGVDVRARKGYYAVAETASAPQRAAEQMAQAIHSPLESTDLSLDVEADAVDVPGARQLKVKITVDPAQLRFQQNGDRWTDNLVEVWMEFDAEGRQVGTHSQTLNLKPSQEEHERILRTGFTFSETITVADATGEIHLVVRDGENGAIGSVIIPLAKLFAQPPATPAPAKQ